MIRRFPEPRDLFDPTRTIFQYSDLDSIVPFTSTVSGTAAGITFNTAALTYTNRYGFATITQGSTSTGRAALGSANQDQIVLNAGEVRIKASILTPSALSDATNRYNLFFGMTGSFTSPGAATNRTLIRYRDNLNSGKWQLDVSNTLGVSTADTGITVAASTFYELELVIGRASGAVTAYINGSRVASVSGQTPNGTSEPLGIIVGTQKTVGTTARPFYADFLTFYQEVDR